MPPEEGAGPVPARLARRRADGRPGKRDLLVALASQRYDPRAMPLGQAARAAAETGAVVHLHPGTARRVLRAHVQALQNGGRR